MQMESLQYKDYTKTKLIADSGKENAMSFQDKKYQGGKALLFLDHDFTGYHTMEWYQCEVNVQLLAKCATQLNLANDAGGKVKSLLKINDDLK
eukprot:2585605-Ditylum_brightwellii.AAC.2